MLVLSNNACSHVCLRLYVACASNCQPCTHKPPEPEGQRQIQGGYIQLGSDPGDGKKARGSVKKVIAHKKATSVDEDDSCCTFRRCSLS